MESIKLDDLNWKDIVLQLTAFAQYLINIDKEDWSKGPMNLPKGNEAKDLAMEAITDFLEDPDKFDPERNESLINFLKFHTVRRLVSNLKKSKENQTTESLITYEDDANDNELVEKYSDSPTLGFYELFIVEGIDADMTIKEIEHSIEDDVEMGLVFNALVYDNSLRHEICYDRGLKTSDYDNILKRLKRKAERIIKKSLE